MLRRLAASALFVLCLTLPAIAAEKAGHDHGPAEHVSDLDGVRIIHAWTRATTGAEALIFFEVENRSGKPVSLTGGESDLGASVTLVGMQFKDGVAEPVELPSVPVKDGGDLQLEPEGLALRIGGLTRPLAEGDVIEVEVAFDIGHVDVDVEVEAEDATGHSHAGHAH
tara:strand:+ start:1704 stop:2207 length:504 start_codon:yes stop_codon:yes gene_type:complete